MATVNQNKFSPFWVYSKRNKLNLIIVRRWLANYRGTFNCNKPILSSLIFLFNIRCEYGLNSLSLPNNVKTKNSNMLFTEKIKELRIQNQMPQRQIAAALDIDTATYCKIEKGERRAKKEQVAILSEMFHVEMTDLLTLWLADKVTDMVSDEHIVASEALSMAAENLRRIG